jgi:hypothetical protein
MAILKSSFLSTALMADSSALNWLQFSSNWRAIVQRPRDLLSVLPGTLLSHLTNLVALHLHRPTGNCFTTGEVIGCGVDFKWCPLR